MEQGKSSFDSFELAIDTDIKEHLKSTANWTMFLAILGFVGIVFMVFLGISVFSLNANYANLKAYGLSYNSVGFIYIIAALAYIFPVYYLFNFSRKTNKALAFNTNQDFKMAFYNLKLHFKYVGIMVVSVILVYVVLILTSLFSMIGYLY